MRRSLATILATMVITPIAAVTLAAPASAGNRHDDVNPWASDYNSCHSVRANDNHSTANYWGYCRN